MEFYRKYFFVNVSIHVIFVKYLVAFILLSAFVFGSCSSPRYLGRTGIVERFMDDPAISDTHVGVAIYDTQKKEYLYNFNGNKFFVPASNTKLATLYAGLKYLGDSIPGIQYAEHNDSIFLRATGDPTFLLEDFSDQPVFDFFKFTEKPVVFIEPKWNTGALGYGWPWNFYLNYYIPERSPFPVYGNIVIWQQRDMPGLAEGVKITYISSYPKLPWQVEINDSDDESFEVKRPLTENIYTVYPGSEGFKELFVPYSTVGMQAAIELLNDTLNKDIGILPARSCSFDLRGSFEPLFKTINSRSSDSLFRPMMLFSDNFYAEQTLIMLSQKLFDKMDEKQLIDYVIENDLYGFPQKPRWVDGSGLSRYNLFSPQSFVWLLEKMYSEFGFERVTNLLPTGGEGTLENFYHQEKGNIFAKTGTLDGNAVALSGFLITQKSRVLIFSVLVNNHNKSSNDVRKAMERFLKDIIYRY